MSYAAVAGGKRILVLLGDYTETLEAFNIQTLQICGHTVHAACPGKKNRACIKTVVHAYEEGSPTFTETPGHFFQLTATFEEISDLSHYAALYIPGGRAPEYLRSNPRVIEIVKYFVDAGKPVGAMGHGIQLLVAAGAIKGRKVSCNPLCAPEVKLAGGEIEEADATVDGKLVTGQKCVRFMQAFLGACGTKFSNTA